MTEIAHGEIRIDVNDAGAIQRLRAVEERMSRFGGRSSTRRVDVDTRGARKALNDQEAQVKRLQTAYERLSKVKASATVKADTRAADAQLRKIRAELAKLGATATEVKVDVD